MVERRTENPAEVVQFHLGEVLGLLGLYFSSIVLPFIVGRYSMSLVRWVNLIWSFCILLITTSIFFNIVALSNSFLEINVFNC